MTPVHAGVAEICAHLGGELLGDATLVVTRIAPLESATFDAISFLANARHAPQHVTSAAGCVIVGPALRGAAAARLQERGGGAVIVCPDPYLAYARLTQWWACRVRLPEAPGVHASAVVEEGVFIDAGAHVGAFAHLARGARLAAGAVVGPHGVVGAGAVVGAGTRLAARVVLGEACRIGARGIVHSGAVIGADGFGFAPHLHEWVKIEQLGAVIIGDDVEIGANTCIDRGALDDTEIGDGVKLDNQIQIGHNVRIGEHCAFAGCVGVAGSAIIGRRCTFGGAAMIAGHLQLVDDVHVSAGTLVSRSILKPGLYSGSFPFDDNAAWEKNAATLRHLHALRHRLRALEHLQSSAPPPT